MCGRIGEHAHAAGGEHLCLRLVAHRQQCVGQAAAQQPEVRMGFAVMRRVKRVKRVEVAGVENDDVGHDDGLDSG